MNYSKVNISIVVLFIFHTVGVIGLSSAYQDLFLTLTPLNLLLSLGLFIWANNDFSIQFYKVISILFALGFLVEVLGVNTGVLFGEYTYGATLGFKLLNTPLMIGVNWILLSLSTFAVCSYFLKKQLPIILLSSLLMVLMDVLIEPIAITLDFWTWTAGDIPLQNYVMWFFISLIMNSIISYNRLKLDYRVSFGLLLSQILFFTLLSLSL
ncbi:MAG: carotenoid biosynthesis protein [Flavobacteriales bacterium]|nr:carotenoid biosynthesis protein [Flavobacteriales bacterium]MBL6872860.1 carotenoid biosynthesis protein [Flavobacteriales bacterium]